jgi:hypothetical protein
MLLVRVLGVAAALALLPDCTNVTRLSAGPAVAFPGDGHESYGEEIALRRGIGTSDFESIGTLEYAARLLVSQETHALSLGGGYSAMKWWGDGLALASLNPAFGLEVTRGKPLGNAGLHAAMGFGWTFDEERRRYPARWRTTVPEICGNNCPSYVTIERRRRVLTLELTGSANLRGTRQPLYTLGFLLGVALTDEQDDIEVPPGPHLFRLPVLPPMPPLRR